MGQSEAVNSACNLILHGEEKLTRGEFLFKIKDKPWVYSPVMARIFLRTAADSKSKDFKAQNMGLEEEDIIPKVLRYYSFCLFQDSIISSLVRGLREIRDF